MKNNLLRNMYAAVVALFVTAFALPQHVQAENYNLLIGGKRVTSENCGDLTAIDGVKGKAKYDPETNTLTLDNATITTTAEKAAGVGLWNSIKDLKVVLIGENAITSEKSGGMVNYEKLTFTGSGKLTITGAMSGNEDYCYGILNPSTVTVDGCTLEISGGVNGITSGRWKFNKCNVRIKGNGTAKDEYKGSMGRLGYVPEFTDCKITAPAGAEWKELKKSGYTFQSLFANGKVVTDWVTIKPNAAPENYNILICGQRVTSENCGDLTAIEGVKGKATFDPATNTLTLENATIATTADKAAGLWTSVKDMTIKLIGDNTISSEKRGGMVNYDKLTFTGTGKLKITGATSGNEDYCYGFLNPGTVTVDGCTLEISGGVNGITSGRWKFNKCNVRIQGGGTTKDEFKGSIGRVSYIPEFTDCKIVTPEGTEWKKLDKSGYIYYSLFANGKVVTDWVTIKPNTTPENYNILIGGKKITSENCGDLTAIEGVKSKATYDPATNTLTFDNATITTTAEKAAGVGLWTSVKGLTIKLIGENTITSEKSGGMVNYEKLTFTGAGKLTINGAMSGNEDYCYGILNPGTITVDGCSLEISGGVNGITSGRWKFNKCNVRVKGNGTEKDEYKGSMGRLGYVPEFTDCKIVSPEGTEWKELKKGSYTFQSLFGSNGKVVTDWVTIQPNDAPETYDLVLESYGENLVAVTKIVKELTGLSLLKAKQLVESAPCIIKENMSQEDAKEARDKLLAAGATASIHLHGTWKPSGINTQTVDTAAKVIYTLQGVRLNTKFENLPAGVYIVNGKKVLKK